MAKVFHCQTMSWDCEYTAQAETETAVLRQVRQHVLETHRLVSFSEELESRVRSAIHNYGEDDCPLCR
ncbi:MAG: DUF1059 domain-containing protein [Anaerolineae bacterium]|nr:DUF1059 domain-containing protein [Anaerolineae bacterium]